MPEVARAGQGRAGREASRGQGVGRAVAAASWRREREPVLPGHSSMLLTAPDGPQQAQPAPSPPPAHLG